MVVISAAVEGVVDEAVAKTLIRDAGAGHGQIYGKKGKPHLRASIDGYNNAARFYPWFVLVDLDHDAACVPDFCRSWVTVKSTNLCFRVAVRAVESWLLADHEAIAKFFSVPQALVPTDPDSEANPKQALVNLAARSRRRSIREDMVPRAGSGRPVGPAYTSRLIEYVQSLSWRPAIAANRSQSLSRCRASLIRLVRDAAKN